MAYFVDDTARVIDNPLLPTVRLEPSSSVVMMVVSRLEIACHVQGDPTPTIEWKKMNKYNQEIIICLICLIGN